MRNTTVKLMLALFMGACLALVGCESDDNRNIITEAEYNSLQEGMTYEEVLGIIGEPHSSKTYGDLTSYSWFYKNDTDFCVVMFRNNRLVHKTNTDEEIELDLPDFDIDIPEYDVDIPPNYL